MYKYGKVVRDKIPEIIEANGEKPVTKVLRGRELLDALIAKLYEEADEIKDNPSADELADLQEVIFAIADQIGVSRAELDKVRAIKVQKRGSFKDGIFLEAVK